MPTAATPPAIVAGRVVEAVVVRPPIPTSVRSPFSCQLQSARSLVPLSPRPSQLSRLVAAYYFGGLRATTPSGRGAPAIAGFIATVSPSGVPGWLGSFLL